MNLTGTKNMIQEPAQDQPTFATLLEQYEYPSPTRGDILAGQVLLLNEKELLIDVGAKRTATVPYTELRELDEKFVGELSVGDEIDVFVTRTPQGEEDLIVSVERILVEGDWDRAEEAFAEGKVLELAVTGFNRGGLVVEFGRLIGFVPNSKIPALRQAGQDSDLQRIKSKMVGTHESMQIIRLDRPTEKFVLSATEAQDILAAKELEQLEVGQTVTGTVTGIKKYGAFVTFGHLTGLLHISKIAYQHLRDPADVLTVGEELELIVEKIDPDKKQVSLSRLALLPDPYETFAAAHEVGGLVEGIVERAVDFGVFVRLEGDIVGLLHISEMIMAPDSHPRDVFHVGERALLAVHSIDTAKQRIGVSQKRISHQAQVAWMMEHVEPNEQVEPGEQVEPSEQVELNEQVEPSEQVELNEQVEPNEQIELNDQVDTSS